MGPPAGWGFMILQCTLRKTPRLAVSRNHWSSGISPIVLVQVPRWALGYVAVKPRCPPRVERV